MQCVNKAISLLCFNKEIYHENLLHLLTYSILSIDERSHNVKKAVYLISSTCGMYHLYTDFILCLKDSYHFCIFISNVALMTTLSHDSTVYCSL